MYIHVYSETPVEERLDLIVSIKIQCIFATFRTHIWLVLTH